MSFDHERLDVYQLSLDFLALADDAVEHLPRGRGHLADQLSSSGDFHRAQHRRGSGEVLEG